jgi:ELWxxDGT repeat protein
LVLFEGASTNGQFTLWETDGTTTGTVQLTAAALDPNNLTAFQGQVLFNGTDSSGHAELWKTNGTAAGTSELMPPIAGAASAGLDPSDLTVFHNEVLFNGEDSRATPGNPVSGLWETNGTSGGTIELAGVGFGSSTSGLDPYDMTVFGSEVLFGATNASNQVGLWETDGTPGGTHEIPGASVLFPSDLTVLGGEVLFSGLDSSGHIGLWETDGTSTSELTGIIGANPGTAPGDPGFDPRFLAAFGNEVLFNGTDVNNLQGLWETNGTPGGTIELLAAAPGGGGSSDPAGLDPSGFEIFNGEVLFSGKDASGKSQLWETNGQPGGTNEVVVAGVSPTAGLAPSDLTAATIIPPTSGSLLWQNNTTGQGSIWDLTGTVLVGGGPVSPNPGPSWRAVGIADFFGGGSSNILWQNTSTGQASIWEMSGTTLIGGGRSAPILGQVGAPSGLAISITTGVPTSCGRIRAPVRRRSGK